MAAARSSRAVPTDLKSVIAAAEVRPCVRAAHQCREIRANVCRGESSRPDCLHNFAGLCSSAGMRIDKYLGAQNGFGIRLAHLRREGSDKIDMLAGLQPVTV